MITMTDRSLLSGHPDYRLHTHKILISRRLTQHNQQYVESASQQHNESIQYLKKIAKALKLIYIVENR